LILHTSEADPIDLTDNDDTTILSHLEYPQYMQDIQSSPIECHNETMGFATKYPSPSASPNSPTYRPVSPVDSETDSSQESRSRSSSPEIRELLDQTEEESQPTEETPNIRHRKVVPLEPHVTIVPHTTTTYHGKGFIRRGVPRVLTRAVRRPRRTYTRGTQTPARLFTQQEIQTEPLFVIPSSNQPTTAKREYTIEPLFRVIENTHRSNISVSTRQRINSNVNPKRQ
jgi:hypothetical protein